MLWVMSLKKRTTTHAALGDPGPKSDSLVDTRSGEGGTLQSFRNTFAAIASRLERLTSMMETSR